MNKVKAVKQRMRITRHFKKMVRSKVSKVKIKVFPDRLHLDMFQNGTLAKYLHIKRIWAIMNTWYCTNVVVLGARSTGGGGIILFLTYHLWSIFCRNEKWYKVYWRYTLPQPVRVAFAFSLDIQYNKEYCCGVLLRIQILLQRAYVSTCQV